MSSASSSPSKSNLLKVSISVLFALLIASGFFVNPASSSAVPDLPILSIAEGTLQGYQTPAGPYLFNNIPFAQPPVGKLRWLPPQLPPPSWTGVRDAIDVSNECFQPAITDLSINGIGVGSEDCLYLNVYTKRIKVVNNDCANKSNTVILNPEKRLSPVLVFVHGGSSITGWSSYPIYDHSQLVANRDVVAVTVNYRLNVFGYLALDVLTANEYKATGLKRSGNYGLLDNIAALKWVKANIAAFGGDPERVTLYGQSTGGTNVVSLYLSPVARGLFHAALSLSASPVLKGDLAFASQQNAPFLSLSGCDKATEEETLECIYALPPQAVLSATPPTWLYSSDFGLVNFSFPDAAIIIVDHYVVPEEINAALHAGFGAEVVLEYGNMAQEIDFGPDERPINLTQTQFAEALAVFTPTLGWNATQTDKIIELYPISKFQNNSLLAYESITNDYLTCGGMRNLNNTATSHPPHTSPIFHHIIHYHPSVPFQYVGPTGWNVTFAGHVFDLVLFLETYAEGYPVVQADRDHTEVLRRFWVDQLATKLTITDTGLWPEYNVAELSGRPNSTWTLEFLEVGDSPTPPFKTTPNYHGDTCVILRDYGFGSGEWTN